MRKSKPTTRTFRFWLGLLIVAALLSLIAIGITRDDLVNAQETPASQQLVCVQHLEQQAVAATQTTSARQTQVAVQTTQNAQVAQTATQIAMQQPSSTAAPTQAALAESDAAVDAVDEEAPALEGAPASPSTAVTTGAADTDDVAALPEPPDDGTQQQQEPPTIFNPFEDAAQDNLSTFAMDVDTASYTVARNYLQRGTLPPPELIRSEEFINFFPMNYEPPQDTDSAFAIHMDAAPSPFVEPGNLLLRVGLQGRTILPEDRDPALLVFVIDTSGSMNQPDRLELAKQSLRVLVGQLRPDDRVGIVIYESTARVILEPTPVSQGEAILSAIDALHSAGSTYAEAGLCLGYQQAVDNMREGEISRVILLSDGVANVGATGPQPMLDTVAQGIEMGVTLSTIGFGMGDYNDQLMEQLANDGNGNYFYVDSIREARRVFVHNLVSTLQVIAYDAKIQVEFNPDVVARYRLIGYENRAVADEDFRNDAVDAGEVGAGHSITALYEVELVRPDAQGALVTTFVRYEDADTRDVVEINERYETADVFPGFEDAPASFRLLAVVAEFSELLRGSPYAADGSYAALLPVLEPLMQQDPYRTELFTLISNATQAR